VPKVLTTNAMIACPHTGRGLSVPTDPIWKVQGGLVLLDGDAGTLPGCFFLPPCFGYQLHSMGLNASRVDGRAVMLATDFIQSVTGFPLLVTESHRVFDNSTPAPLPSGGPPPPTPPELQDTDQPTVDVVPPLLPFSLATFQNTGQPATLAATFTLQSQFPRRWLLTLLNAPLGLHTDVTNGIPANLDVSPPGGGWTASPLTVTVTLKGTFMATLPPKDHYLVLTGLNFRGRSQFAQVHLQVNP
jgi:hypothetical protein